ncbi:MAG: hypothetical protein RL148_2087 [Planctomycetota bacterium]|jgi:hypothetical protein
MTRWLGVLFLAVLGCTTGPKSPQVLQADVCVYGATSAGVAAAVQASRQGNTVVLLDPDHWVGGLTTSGLGATDVGNKDAIGGIAREFHRRLRAHYDAPGGWHREDPAKFKGRGHAKGDDAAWTFEPSVAQAQLGAMLAQERVELRRGERLDRTPRTGSAVAAGVELDGASIRSVRMESGLEVRARVFLDCTYEGDLMAAAGVSYTVGREPNARHGETLNGVQVGNAKHHQFLVDVDPYVVPGDPASGLLPGIRPGPLPADGSGDALVQAYCYRICATDDPDNRVPWPKPEAYDERDHELLLRWFEAGATMAPWHPVPMPNRKTDSNNNGAVSTDHVGANWDWPEASYAERARIAAEHRRHNMGLLWTLANHERVPEKVRAVFQRFGLAKDEFVASGHWPPLLYVREGRRMVGESVVTEHHCMGTQVVSDPVGMGAYAMDSHNVQRYVDAGGKVRNEGDVQVRVPRPYGIGYGSLVPRRVECTNLLVPVACSASHIAYGSIRMEPVFMVLAQSASVAAGIALEQGIAVQDVPYSLLRERLLQLGQVLEWRPAGRPGGGSGG